jgi:hypothetical protein
MNNSILGSLAVGHVGELRSIDAVTLLAEVIVGTDERQINSYSELFSKYSRSRNWYVLASDWEYGGGRMLSKRTLSRKWKVVQVKPGIDPGN